MRMFGPNFGSFLARAVLHPASGLESSLEKLPEEVQEKEEEGIAQGEREEKIREERKEWRETNLGRERPRSGPEADSMPAGPGPGT
jgi:hypothetical protein